MNEKLIGNNLVLCTHTEWYENEKPFIQDLSPDLEWVISRQRKIPNTAMHIDKVYYQRQELEQNDGIEWDEIALFAMQRIEDGEAYEQMGEEKIKKWEKIIQKARGWKADAFWEYLAKNASAIDEYGKLLAVAAPDNKSIEIYSMESGEELYHMQK